MKKNEYLTVAFIHAILSILTSFISIFNLPAIFTTYGLLDNGIEHQNQYHNNTKLIFIDKILLIISIISTILFSLIYLNVLF